MISNRRRGQGMTEYIILVGLIGILLVAAVTRFKNQIQVTIEGSAGVLAESSIAPGDTVGGLNPDGTSDGSTYTKVGSPNIYRSATDTTGRGPTYVRNSDGTFSPE